MVICYYILMEFFMKGVISKRVSGTVYYTVCPVRVARSRRACKTSHPTFYYRVHAAHSKDSRRYRVLLLCATLRCQIVGPVGSISLHSTSTTKSRSSILVFMEGNANGHIQCLKRGWSRRTCLRRYASYIILSPESYSQETQVVDAIKDLVQDCNFDCNDSGVALQAMDNSHVALVSMMLKAESFSPFRCDRNIALGINLSSLMKVLRCAQNEDILTLKAEDAPDVVNLVFETSESDRISEYDIKLMDIDQEHLGIPETEYAATITMPSAEFQRICRDLMALSESGTSQSKKILKYYWAKEVLQCLSKLQKKALNSLALVTSATERSLFGATPTSTSQIRTLRSLFRNRFP